MQNQDALINDNGAVIGGWILVEDSSEYKWQQYYLDESKQYYNSLFKYNPDAIYVLNYDGNFINVNPAARKISGYSEGEYLQKSFMSLIAPEYLEKTLQYFNRVLQGEVQNVETAIMHKNGHIVELSLTGVPIIVENKVVGVTGIAKDITESKRAEEELRKSEERYRQLIEFLPDVFLVHCEGRIVFINKAAEKLLGASSSEELIGKPVMDIVHPEYHEIVKKRIYQIQEKGEIVPLIEEKFIRLDGSVVDVEISGSSVNFQGKPAVQVVVRDITKKKKVETELRESEEKFRMLFHKVNDEIILFEVTEEGLPGCLIDVNDAICHHLGYSREELLKMSLWDIIDKESQNKHPKIFQGLLGKECNTFETTSVSKDGKKIPVEVNAHSFILKGKRVVLSVARDITDRKKAEKQINYMAHHDPLTGLPNRYSLNSCLKQSLERNKRKKQMIAIMFIDLDRFKIINDTMGHNFGDRLLQQISKRLKTCLHREDIVFRYGGDEFIIMLENVNRKEASEVAQKIVNEFSYPFMFDSQKIFISSSIGISIYPTDGEDMEMLIRNADMSMYHAKAQGRNNYKFYTPNLYDEVSSKMKLENGLRKALENDEFTIYYQPQVELNSERIVGMEALIRWQHPELGLISPSEFIPIAEETGLIVPLGKWILKNACKQNKDWQESGFSSITVAVNISNYQIKDKDFIDTVIQALKESQLDPQYLELEITESIMQNIKETTLILDELKMIGVKIAIDDFGTGYSSLSVIKDLTFEKLKIDKSFINDILTNPKISALVKTIIDMGQNLNINVIAEGIEEERQVIFLKQNKCIFGQGYFFSRPLPAKDISKILSSR